jgi:type I restriction enzyme, S subunit
VTLRVPPDEIVERSSSALLGIHPAWKRVRLGDVADVLNGFAFKSAFFTKNGGVPLVRIRDVGQSETEAFYTGEYEERYLVQPGDLIIGMDGDFRTARWSGPTALLNQRVCRLTVRSPDLYDEAFLYYALPGYLDAVHAFTSSVTVKHLSSRTITDLPLPLPPLAEQRRIVAAIEEQFSRLDAAEGLLRSATRRAGAFRASLLGQATAHDAMARVGEVATLSDGPFGSNLKTSHYVDSGPRVVRLQNIGDAAFRDEKAHITDGHFSRLSKHAVRPGDVVAASLGHDVPRACLVPDWLGPAIVKADCIRLRPGAKIDASFLMWSLNSRPVKRQAAERIKGIGRPRLGLRGLRELRIPLPPLAEQHRIVAEIEQQLSLIDSLRAAVEAAQKRSAALRRAILERAFRGELVPQDPADEPASVLLERIRAERAAAPKPSRRRATMKAP